MRSLRALTALAATTVMMSGCLGYRLMRPEEIEIPNYDPRAVVMPPECEGLILRAAETRMVGMPESEARMVSFCQQQQVIRAQEEEAAARKIESHARAGDFALHVATVVVGATLAVLSWVF